MKRMSVSVTDKLYEELKKEDISPSFLVRYGYRVLQGHKALNEKYYDLEARMERLKQKLEYLFKEHSKNFSELESKLNDLTEKLQRAFAELYSIKQELTATEE